MQSLESDLLLDLSKKRRSGCLLDSARIFGIGVVLLLNGLFYGLNAGKIFGNANFMDFNDMRLWLPFVFLSLTHLVSLADVLRYLQRKATVSKPEPWKITYIVTLLPCGLWYIPWIIGSSNLQRAAACISTAVFVINAKVLFAAMWRQDEDTEEARALYRWPLGHPYMLLATLEFSCFVFSSITLYTSELPDFVKTPKSGHPLELFGLLAVASSMTQATVVCCLLWCRRDKNM